MRTTPFLLLLLLSACESGRRPADTPGQPPAAAPTVQTARLVGLYEGEGRSGLSQMCVIDRPDGDSRFAIVVRTDGGGSCSGAGGVARSGTFLSLAMAGDRRCRIEGRIEGDRVTLPATLPADCSYYCAPGATMAGSRFRKTGGSAADALRAKDLVGDPLCGGMDG